MRPKKAPYDLHKQYVRITDYLMFESWKNGAPSDKKRDEVVKKVEKLKAIYERYIANIYKSQGVDPYRDSAAKANHVWFSCCQDSKEYMNN